MPALRARRSYLIALRAQKLDLWASLAEILFSLILYRFAFPPSLFSKPRIEKETNYRSKHTRRLKNDRLLKNSFPEMLKTMYSRLDPVIADTLGGKI